MTLRRLVLLAVLVIVDVFPAILTSPGKAGFLEI